MNVMTKKAYFAPMTQIVEVQALQLMAGSPKISVDEETINYDETPGNASGGLGRQRHDVWEDEEDEEL